MINELDRCFLERTLELAENGRLLAPPNPLVGALVVDGETVLGEGCHQRWGTCHGEVAALEAVPESLRKRVPGATLYVNLEPCGHSGKTGPCTKEIERAGIRRVVCCHRDPNPTAKGGAVELERAGVAVDFLESKCADDQLLLERAVALNARFLFPLARDRPIVTLKWAMSLDGKIATRSGESQWISSSEGRDWALDLRLVHDAIVVGSGTVLADDPRLNRRVSKSGGDVVIEAEIVRVVLDRRLRWQPPAAMFSTPGEILVFTAAESLHGDAGRQRASNLTAAGATVVPLDAVTPSAVLGNLYERDLGSVLVEGGASILGCFLDAGIRDRVAVCCAPLLIGGRKASGPVAGRGVDALAQATRLHHASVRRMGTDSVIEGISEQCLQDLLSSVAGS